MTEIELAAAMIKLSIAWPPPKTRGAIGKVLGELHARMLRLRHRAPEEAELNKLWLAVEVYGAANGYPLGRGRKSI
jgi:hypothetical protein